MATNGEVPHATGHAPTGTPPVDGMGGPVHFRRFVRADVAAVRILLWEVWQETYTPILGAEGVAQHCAQLHTRARLNALAVDLDHHCNLVAEAGGRIVAFASAQLGWTGAVDVYELYVAGPHQRRGIGKALMARLFAHFPGAHTWRIEVLDGNHAALTLYEHMGFRRTGSRPDWHQPEIAVLQLAKPGDPSQRYSYAALIAIQLRSLLQSFDPRR